MDRILIILKKENDPVPGLNTIIFKHVCWYMQQISGERLQDHWSSDQNELKKMSRRMGKPTISIGENKGADQLRSNCEADQRLCFRYTDSTIPLLSKSDIPSL